MAVALKQGTFSWNELLTNDVEASREFYTQLFGWAAEASPSPGGEYTVFKIGDQQIGGMMQLPARAQEAGASSYWGSYITVDNVDDMARKAEELGAAILQQPMDIPDVGRFCLIRDPQGAMVSLIQYSRNQG